MDICLYFQVHQPVRYRKYQIFDIGKDHDYFDWSKNKEIISRVTNRCYLPANRLVLELIKKHNIRVAFSFSGVLIEQLKKYEPEALASFKELAKTGNVEILSETYYHSLAFLYSEEEFKKQVAKHRKLIKEEFGLEPTVFRNTELIYNNALAKFAEENKYAGVLAEGADSILGWRSPNFLYNPKNSKIGLLLKNFKLSDDIAFRFSNRNWDQWPLTAEKFAGWLEAAEGDIINLFMDYETFGEHQWADTGIFRFLEKLPSLVKHKFITPCMAFEKLGSKGDIDMPDFVSWADSERDVTAWLGNNMQKNAISELYNLEKAVLKTNDPELIQDWRLLQASDHFYYMCTKFFMDGDVHKYFNPYESPYEAFIAYQNILNDIVFRINKTLGNKSGLKIDGAPSRNISKSDMALKD